LLIAQSLDWLTCNITDVFPDSRLFELMRLADSSSAGAVETSYRFLDVPLMVKRGVGSCLLVLHAKDWFSVSIMAEGAVKPSQVTAYSRPLWEYGNDAVISHMQGFIDMLWSKVGVRLEPSRFDLASDVTGFPVRQFDSRAATRARFVTRLRELRFMGGKETETVYLGKDGAVRLSIYNKTADCAAKGKDYYFPTWRAAGWSPDDEVTRIEYKCMREFVRSWHLLEDGSHYPLGDVWQLLEQLPAIHQYLTLSHTRMVIPDAAEANQTRLDLDPVWVLVASPWQGDVTISPGARMSHFVNDRDKLEKQVSGAFLSYVALMDSGEDYSMSEISRGVVSFLARLEKRKGANWRQLVITRRAQLLARVA
jgi:hypothetical protein